MAVSSISKHPGGHGPRLSSTMDEALRHALGHEIRRRRISRAMTQAQLGSPLTRAFVSSVESGRTVPSLPALLHLATGLGIPLSELFEGAEAVASHDS